MNDGSSTAHDFVLFCFRRRPVTWPLLYDEMCNVAGRRLFRDMGYDELREFGVDFSLIGLGRMARLAQDVIARHETVEARAS